MGSTPTRPISVGTVAKWHNASVCKTDIRGFESRRYLLPRTFMLALLGDLHGLPGVLEDAARKAFNKGASRLIVLGDIGIYPETLAGFIKVARESPIPIDFIDGNHEDFRMLAPWWEELERTEATAYHVVRDKLRYIRRGAVLRLDGRRIAFLGGAGSIDYNYRTPGRDWFPEEQIRMQDLDYLYRCAAGQKVDLFLVHTPPQSVITKHFDTPRIRAVRVRQMFGAPPDWFDPSAHKVQEAWERLNFPPVFAGHMHHTLQDMGCRIVNINELVYV